MWKPSKTAEELSDFWNEIVVANGPRYRNPKEWHHLWIDFWNALFDMNYTWGHVVGIGLPLWGLYALYGLVSGWFYGP